MTKHDLENLIKYEQGMVNFHKQMLDRYKHALKELAAKQAAARKKRVEKSATEETFRILERLKLKS